MHDVSRTNETSEMFLVKSPHIMGSPQHNFGAVTQVYLRLF